MIYAVFGLGLESYLQRNMQLILSSALSNLHINLQRIAQIISEAESGASEASLQDVQQPRGERSGRSTPPSAFADMTALRSQSCSRIFHGRMIVSFKVATISNGYPACSLGKCSEGRHIDHNVRRCNASIA